MKTYADFNFRELRHAGPIGEEIAKLQRAIRALLPVETPTVRAEMPGDGLRLHAKVGGGGAPPVGQRMTLITEKDFYLECDANGTTFYVAKPDHFYSSDASGVGVQSINYTGTAFSVPGSALGSPLAVSALDCADSVPGFIDDFITDLNAPGFCSRNLIRTVAVNGDTVYQVITPPYMNGESPIYALRLAQPITLDGQSCTHIDLNVECRRWEAINYSPFVLDASLHPNGPVSFTRQVRTSTVNPA